MLKKRLIPILLLQNGLLVRSELFKIHQVIGNPVHEVQRFNEWKVDELIYLDISRDDVYDLRRDDQKVRGLTDANSVLLEVSRRCFMPLTWGGRIKTVDQMHQRISSGADKIAINTQAFREPRLITEGAKLFGSQAIVISMDVLRHPDGRAEVFIDGGRSATHCDPITWTKQVEEYGAGEILLQSIDRDGTGKGYDLELIEAVTSETRLQVIVCGVVGRDEHYAAGIAAGASAVAAANIWHFKEMADLGGKRALVKAGVDVRL